MHDYHMDRQINSMLGTSSMEKELWDSSIFYLYLHRQRYFKNIGWVSLTPSPLDGWVCEFLFFPFRQPRCTCAGGRYTHSVSTISLPLFPSTFHLWIAGPVPALWDWGMAVLRVTWTQSSSSYICSLDSLRWLLSSFLYGMKENVYTAWKLSQIYRSQSWLKLDVTRDFIIASEIHVDSMLVVMSL